MAQLGHADPRFTLRVYIHLMSRRDGERGRLKALVEGADWAETGRKSDFRSTEAQPAPDPETQNPRRSRGFAKWALLGSNQ